MLLPARRTMHELSLAADLVAAIERNLAPRSARVVRVIVSIGSASGIVLESLRFAFEAVAVGTRLAGANLDIATVAACSRCVDCGIVFDFVDLIGRCPACGRLGGKLISGNEVILRAIEVADV
jgi:hydrogenase nickel incorporation protein HypA/HybF